MSEPPACWISYKQCEARNEAVAPERDWYGCRKCGERYPDPRARSDEEELKQEVQELRAWEAGKNKREGCLRGKRVTPVRVRIKSFNGS